MLYALIAIFFICIFSILYLVLTMVFDKERSIDKLKYFDDGFAQEVKSEPQKERVSLLKLLSRLMSKTRRPSHKIDKLELDLTCADIPITPDEFRTIRLLSSLALAFLGYALTKSLFGVLIVFAIAWMIPRIVINKRKKDRITSFNMQLNEGVMIISNSLKAGYSFLQAIAVSSDEMTDPFAKEFKKLLKEMSLGITEEVAFKNMHLRMPSDELRLIMNAVLIQKDIGGNLSEILDNIGATLRERQRMKDELKALIAQGKMSGIIISLLPLLMGVAIFLLNRSYIMTLFTTPLGIALLVGAAISEAIGLFIIKKIVNIDM